MNHQVVALGVISVAEDRQRRLCGFVISVDLVDDEIGPFLQPFFQNVLLPCIVVTAAACDQQYSERFGCDGAWLLRLGGAKGEGEQNKEQEKEGFAGMIWT